MQRLSHVAYEVNKKLQSGGGIVGVQMTRQSELLGVVSAAGVAHPEDFSVLFVPCHYVC